LDSFKSGNLLIIRLKAVLSF